MRRRHAALLGLSVMLLASCSHHGEDGSPPPPPPPPPPTTPTAANDGDAAHAATEAVSAAPAVLRVGRFDERDPDGPKCGWPGCRILASFDGASVTARLDEAAGYDGPSEWDFAIDGVWKPKLVLQPGAHDYDLATGLASGKHLVELYKRTESQSGVTKFLGFDFHGGTLLSPPPRSGRRIEIVGDSDVAGYGYEGALTGTDCNGEGWLGRYQDFHEGWGARLAEKLDAELAGTVFSGKGFVYNAWRPDTETIDVLYPRANPEDATSTFDLSKLVPDAVIVAIGGNDYNVGEPTDDGPAPLDTFTAKVRAFTAMLRSSYAKAHLFLMVYAALDDDPPDRARRTNVSTAFQTVVSERNAAGDDRVSLLVPAQYTTGELIACSGHGGPAYHERIATYVAAELGARLGWK
jgi:hypothetical protein